MTEFRTITDLTTLMEWRREVIEHVFGQEPSPALLRANEDYYRKHIAAGSHLAVVALYDGIPAGCGSVCFSEELPSPDNHSGLCGYLMNIYVKEPYRTHGIGHSIVKHLIREALHRGCGKIYLETTDDGRPVYESLGFHDMKDMMKLDYGNTDYTGA